LSTFGFQITDSPIKSPNVAHSDVDAEAGPPYGALETEEDLPRNDALIWSLYLKRAKEVAKQRAEHWKTSLDNLLLFVSYSIQTPE